HNLADVGLDFGLGLRFSRNVDVDALLPERQSREEYDEQHEEHVDQRGDVHVTAGLRDLGLDDLVGPEVMMRVRHYCAPPAPPSTLRFSVPKPMSSMPAWRSWSIAAITAPYSTSSSPL